MNENLTKKHWFIQVSYWNPSSHERDWCIVGENNTEVQGEENAMLFDSEQEAKKWTKSEDAKPWLPCTFSIKESIY